jgi:ferritin-like metal-binding protein YciE
MTEITEQLTKYLTDAHSIEEQALAQLRTAPEIAGDPELSAAYREHLRETEGHERITHTRCPTRRSSSRRTSCSAESPSGPTSRRSASRPSRSGPRSVG